MSDQFFQELNLPRPDVELGVGSGSQAAQTAAMLTGIESAILEHGPDAVLVYGDTNSTLAGALAAAKMHVPIAHVEAGLRSFNRRMPEEVNRLLADRLSSMLLCPSETAATNLRNEGITSGVHVVGDVMADVLANFDRGSDASILAEFKATPQQYFVATVHRAANTDDPSRLASIVRGLAALPLRVILPVHPRLKQALSTHRVSVGANVTVVNPVGYAAMIALVRNAKALLTDSGGLQKEAYWLAVPCITLREETEWVETVAAGWNTLAGADTARIAAAALAAERPASRPSLYGDGKAAERIIEAINTWN